jgi:hypothetical protein
MDEKMMAIFPTGKPRETQLEKINCKHCKRPFLKQAIAEHIPLCLKAKQEKARKKKEARDAANRAKEKGPDTKEEDVDGDTAMKGQKSAKKSATEDGAKKGKKRKADDDDSKEPKKKKKKDEPKAKVPKPKGPVDVEKQCGVPLPNGGQCARSLTCKTHSMGAKRSVPGRSLPYDMLLQAYQKKNQARQQSVFLKFLPPTIHPPRFPFLSGSGALQMLTTDLQRPPLTQMLLSTMMQMELAPSIPTRNAILLWLDLLDHVHSL